MDFSQAQESSHRIRSLSASMVEKAQSGHPGAPMGQADFLTVLFSQFLRITPQDISWPNRDRFILSSGHACAGLYALYHSCGFDFSMSDLQEFRTLNSKTPGHPEYELPIEATTGPLSHGLAQAVGQAMAQKRLQALCPDGAINYRVYVTVGDGCLSEGLAQEALSLAGHLQLDNLIVLYDSNCVTIDGDLQLSFSENIEKRLDSLAWNYIQADGHDFHDIYQALSTAIKSKGPQFIEFKTSIGKHLPSLEGSAQSHGAPVGEQELELLNKGLNINCPWTLPKEHYEFFGLEKKFAQELETWKRKFETSFQKLLTSSARLTSFEIDKQVDKTQASRKTFSQVLCEWSLKEPLLLGGSCDLAASCYTNWPHSRDYQSENTGNNIHFGIREHAAAAICHGLSAAQLYPYCATFLVFSDFMLPAIRLSALSKHKVLYIFTHDSVAVGQDGPTHQPVEQLTHLRDIDGLRVFRPYNTFECHQALENYYQGQGPVAIVLSRQSFFQKSFGPEQKLIQGVYCLNEESKAHITLLGSGADVALCLQAAQELKKTHDLKIRVLSVASLENVDFDQLKSLRKKDSSQWIVFEASTAWHWTQIVSPDSIKCIRSFGQSGPGDQVLKNKGFDLRSACQFILKKCSKLDEKI